MGFVDVSKWVRVVRLISVFKLLNELIFVFGLYLFILKTFLGPLKLFQNSHIYYTYIFFKINNQ